MGVSITEWVSTLLDGQSIIDKKQPISPAIEAQAREKFRNHAGAVSLGQATNTDNDQIDTDLVKAYVDDY